MFSRGDRTTRLHILVAGGNGHPSQLSAILWLPWVWSKRQKATTSLDKAKEQNIPSGPHQSPSQVLPRGISL